MRWRLTYLPHLEEDAPALEAKLDRLGERGWTLRRTALGCVGILEAGPEGTCCVRPAVPRAETEYVPDYAEAGWEVPIRLRDLEIFCSRPVCRPEPLPEPEGKRTSLWRRLGELFLVLILMLALFLFWRRGETGLAYRLLFSPEAPFLLLSALMLACNALWMPLWRRFRGETAGRFWPQVRGTLALLPELLMKLVVLIVAGGLLLTLFWGYSGENVAAHRPELREHPLVMAEDLGLDPAGVYYLSYDPLWSVQVRGERYVELLRTEEGTYTQVYCDRYRAPAEGLARMLLRALREEAGRENLYGGLVAFAPAELGFAESWAAPDGSFLLLREGRTVALVGVRCTGGNGPDLRTDPLLPALRAALELN